MLAAADLVDLLVHEFAGLGARRLPRALVLPGFLDDVFLRHGCSSCGTCSFARSFTRPAREPWLYGTGAPAQGRTQDKPARKQIDPSTRDEAVRNIPLLQATILMQRPASRAGRARCPDGAPENVGP